MATKEQYEALIAAIEKNGWKQTIGVLFSVKADGEIMACAAGQAVLNLGVITEEEVRNGVNRNYTRSDGGFESPFPAEKAIEYIRETFGPGIYGVIYNLNDSYEMNCKQIAISMRAWLEERNLI